MRSRRILALLLALLLMPFECGATSYYLATAAGGGSDSNNGTSAGTPWLTPNHALNCGDTITAASSTAYSSGNFANAKWGTVSNCPSTGGDYFAHLNCGTAFACQIADTSSNATRVDKSNWMVQGWQASSTVGACFYATPSSTYSMTYVAFVNDIASTCQNSGVQFAPYYANNTYGVDYIAIVGVIAYNGANGGTECYSGGSVYEPKQADTQPGTHIFIDQFFAISNIDPVSGCPGNSDGEGFIFDDWADQQGNGLVYTGQGVLENSLMLGNGSAGVEVFSTTGAPIYVTQVTTYGDYQSTVHEGTYNGEGLINSGQKSQWFNNIFQASLATQNSNAVYGFLVGSGVFNATGTNQVYSNYIFGVSGNNTSNQGTGFTFGANTLATPNFINATIPGAPNCASYATTTACMATTILNFTPQAAGAIGKGYQLPSPNPVYDPFYPTWLYNQNFPAGLVSVGSVTGSILNGAQITELIVH